MVAPVLGHPEHSSACILIGTQPKKSRLTQQHLARPFGEPDFGNELRLYPMRLYVALDRRVERRRFAFHRAELGMKLQQKLVRKSGSDVTYVAKTFAVVRAEQKRAETFSASARLGVA